MIMIIKLILIYFFILAVAILWHELGHLIYFRKILKRKIKLRYSFPLTIDVGKPKDYRSLDLKQRIILSLSGIVAGAIPLLLLALYFDLSFIMKIFLFLAYSFGCWRDISKLKEDFILWR